MAIPLSHDVLWTSYEDVEAMLHKVCRTFAKRVGCHEADLSDKARDLYLTAHAKYDPTRSRYTTYVWRAVWYGLLEDQRTTARHARRLPVTERVDDRLPAPTTFDLDKFLIDLSADARTVARLALETERRTNRGRRQAVLDFLHDLRWSAERIAESFSELREDLS